MSFEDSSPVLDGILIMMVRNGSTSYYCMYLPDHAKRRTRVDLSTKLSGRPCMC